MRATDIDFNKITADIENWHARKGTEVNHDGEIVFVDTAWACGMVEADDMT
jgi:hypothetical protein